MGDQDSAVDLSDFDGDIGPCESCGYEEELDGAGLCAGCNPVSETTREALMRALNTSTKEATASGTY